MIKQNMLQIEDEKEKLAELFFECARYDRNSTDWIKALDDFVEVVLKEYKEEVAQALPAANTDAVLDAFEQKERGKLAAQKGGAQ